ncbi:MAG: ATP-binding cassette domain-containing protein [Magnetococcales bacterium]|nr:ATP-binding cassette domain-containing protein [Magnetococcales bacterium]
MNLWLLLRREALHDLMPIVWLAIGAGTANLLVLIILNETLVHMMEASEIIRFSLMFAISAALFTILQKKLMYQTASRIEQALRLRRDELLDRICDTGILQLWSIGANRIVEVVGNEINVVSETVPVLVIGLHSIVVLFLSFLYLLYISNLAAVLVLIVMFLSTVIGLRLVRRMVDIAHDAHVGKGLLVDHVSALIKGIREAKINPLRLYDIKQEIHYCSNIITERRMLFNMHYSYDYTWAELSFYSLLAVTIFIMPLFVFMRVEDESMIINAISFLIYPLQVLVSSFPTYMQAENAAKAIRAVEQRLAENPVSSVPKMTTTESDWGDFDTIILEQLRFSYQDVSSSLFQVGPLNWTIQRGQVVFISGGNGSGKSTLIHMLLGLYPAQGGAIYVDGNLVQKSNLSLYQQMFSVVFYDICVSQNLYGIANFDEDLADQLLEIFEMREKVRISNRSYSTVDLSGGQRKRLVLMSAILEKKPILILDEWASDQSPEFRDKFYRHVVPWLKARGTTLIAITHDDAYFDVADHLLHMEHGEIAWIKHQGSTESK